MRYGRRLREFINTDRTGRIEDLCPKSISERAREVGGHVPRHEGDPAIVAVETPPPRDEAISQSPELVRVPVG
jgi:hypothetical protein